MERNFEIFSFENINKQKIIIQEEIESGRNSDIEKIRREKSRHGENQKREDGGEKVGSKNRFIEEADTEISG